MADTTYTIRDLTIHALAAHTAPLGNATLGVVISHPIYKQLWEMLETHILAGDLESTKMTGRQLIRWVRAGDYRTEGML